MDIQDVLKRDFVKALIHDTCGQDTVLVERDNSYAVRATYEGARDIHRVIFLPPRGFTANQIEQMNSHDEAEKATIEIKGAIKDDKRGFSRLKNSLLVASRDEDQSISDLNQPYLTFDVENPNDPAALTKHSAGDAPFHVVRSNGDGFYHNLINLTDEWMALKLHKVLRPQRGVELWRVTDGLSKDNADTVEDFYAAIVEHGDDIFKNAPEVVERITNLPSEISLPALGEMLHVHDSGMHEACTVFATILKIGKNAPAQTTLFLRSAITREAIPSYYGQQLIGKLSPKYEQSCVA